MYDSIDNFTFDIRYYHGGKFETHKKGKIVYVEGISSLQFGFMSNRFSYNDVMNTGSKLMGGQPFEAYFKLKGKSLATGMQRLNSESQMINLLKSRDKDNTLDIYFIDARKGSVTKTPTKNPNFSFDSVTEPNVQMMASPMSLRRSPRSASSPNPLRRSPRLATSPILEPVRRLQKLPTRRKLSETYERENEGSNGDVVLVSDKQKGKQVVSEFESEVDEDFDEDFDGGNGYDDGYWTEDSQLSEPDIGNNEVDGDFVEDEELFTDIIDESLIDRVNKNLNQSCAKTKETINRFRSNILNVEYLAALEDIKSLSQPAYEYVKAIPPKHWSRHAFRTTCKSSMITNNLCESFNAVLKDARDKPILTHMEWMRRYIMKRNYEKREGADKYEKPFMPYIDKCFKRLIAERRYCKVYPSRNTNFEVDYKGGSFTVNLINQVCNCKHWELSGIPCVHAMACILEQRHIPDDYVDQAYSKDKYLLAYTPAIDPMPGVAHWEKADQEEPLPPLMRRMPGRPSKKKRRKEPGEGSQVKRVKKSNKCGRCGTLGHNIKGCKNAVSDPSQEAKVVDL